MVIPKYLRIKNDLKQQILNGKFEYGDLFYSESELEKKYQVSSITVIRSIKELVKEGYLVRYQGKGTFVSRSRKQRPVRLTDIEVFTGSFDHDSVAVLSIKKGNNAEILDELGLTEHDSYYEFIRLRSVADIPFMLHYSYIPARYVRGDLTDKSRYESLYKRFVEDFGIHLFDEPFTEVDEIVAPNSPEVMNLLGIDAKTPVVKQTKKTFVSGEDNAIAEYVIAYKKWDFFKIKYTTIDA